MDLKWQYFPSNKRIPQKMESLVTIFDAVYDEICSENHRLHSDAVLALVRPGLENLGYSVEKSKCKEDKIEVPVSFGQNGATDLKFEADAFLKEKGIVIEVEAGRAVSNYQF